MKPLTSLVLTLFVAALLAAVGIRLSGALESGESVTVVHWTTGHLLRDGSGLRLLRQMANEFNKEEHRTSTGKRVKVEVYYLGGADQAPELISRVTRGVPLDRELPDPVLVTPSASHWLVNVNYEAGREVIDLRDTLSRSLARSYVGIVTYREMAECLGWPKKEIGYAEIIELRNDPRGWGSYSSCARAEWGVKPLMAFTDPSTSDTGRAVLLSLYAMAAGKLPEELTQEDITRPEVVAYVKQFQGLVDHYMIGTIPLNTKVYQGPRYGQFFIMPEDNLVHLLDGTEVAYIDGVETRAPPLTREMVMIYPKEGSLLRENCACAVQASWVSEEEREAGEAWFRYLREDRQQSLFMKAGFRPGTSLAVADPISPAYGLTAATPTKVLNAERVQPAIARAIDLSWEDVKRPGLVTFVLDTSGSMEGEKLKQAKEGMILALDNMARNNQVALVTFSDTVVKRVPMAPLAANRFPMTSAVERLVASGSTALYDAIVTGIEVSDTAEGPPDAIRAVVVMTDGIATGGKFGLSDVVSLSSRGELPVSTCRAFQNGSTCLQDGPRPLAIGLNEVIGAGLKAKTTHPVQIFFIGIGDADLNVGRILSQATGAEFQGVTDKDLAKVLAEFSKYF